jgi:hypothetical protein
MAAKLGSSTAINADTAIRAATIPDLLRRVVPADVLSVNKSVLFFLFIMLSGVSAMVRPENVENDLDIPRTIADTLPLN